jgi:menaquinone-dependent protoporphyrinogen oxidase
MKVLIVAASRHGSTDEIADAIAARLRERGHEADVFAPEDAPPLASYDAVVIGSAVYVGNWMKAARSFVEANSDSLVGRPVWLFSSGPLDDAEAEALPSEKVEDLETTTRALGHHVFTGRLDRNQLSLAERMVTKMVHAPDGDFRDWDDIARWADSIADTLSTA